MRNIRQKLLTLTATIPVLGLAISALAQPIDVPANLAASPPLGFPGGSLKGEYWKRPPVSILSDGRVNRTNGIDNQIRTFGPADGTFMATLFNYTGNDLSLVKVWLGTDGDSFVGTTNNLDDGALRFTGYINVPTAGTVNLGLTSDDGSRITIGGVDIAERDGSHGDETQDMDVNFASAGLYPIEITFFNGDWTSDGNNHSGNPDPSVHGGANFHLRVAGANVGPAQAAMFHPSLPSPLPNVLNIGGNKIGTVTDNGGSSFSVVAGGNDIWDQRDEFTYAYTEVTGDFDVQVRVDSLQFNANWSKAGLMARESLSEFSRMAFVRVTPAGGANDTFLAYRTGLDNVSGVNGGNHEDRDAANPLTSPGYPNAWLRLVRSGSTILASNSADGVTWNFVSSQDTTTWGGGAFPQNLYLGLATSRHSGGPTAAAEYRNFQFNYSGPFSVVSASSRGNPNGVRVVFNHPVGAGAADPLNYTLDNGVTVSAVSAASSATSVQLTTSILTEGTTYNLTVGFPVQDTSGQEVTVATASFVHGAGYEAGPIRVTHNKTDDSGYYRNSDAVAKGIGDVVALGGATFPGLEANTVFEDPIPDTGSNERFSSRVAGVLNITTSGNYTFYMSSDDVGYLYLSTDDQPGNKVEIAREPNWNGRREYVVGGNQASRGTPPSNISVPISLQAGSKYYLELIFTEGGGGNNGSATWLPPGGAAVANGSEPIPAANFMPSRNFEGNLFYALGPVQIVGQPTNATVSALTPATFRVRADGTPNYSYQWRRNGVNIPGATGPSYTIPLALPSDDGAAFSVVVANEFSSATSSAATLGVVSPESPHLLGVASDASFSSLFLRFDNRLEPASAQNTANYTIPGLTILSATVAPNGKDVVVRTSPQAQDTAYVLTVQDVKELLAVKTLEPNPTNVNFRSGAVLAGTLVKEYYFNLGGGAVADLVNSAKYINHQPDLVCFTNLFELTDRDTYDNYGARILGLFTPDRTGNWKFYMSSDDGGELWLSTDISPSSRVRIAREPVWNGRRDWTGTARRNATAPENQSAAIPLVAGQQYYIELLMKEGGGGDNAAAAAQFLGDPNDPNSVADPIPANGDNVMGPTLFSALINTENLNVSITDEPDSLTVDENASASFTVAATINNFYNCETRFRWQRDGLDIAPGDPAYALSNNGFTLTLSRAALTDTGAKFRCTIEIPLRTPTTSAEATLTVQPDTLPPSIASVKGSPFFDSVTVVFSELIDGQTAVDIFNYTINNGINIESATLGVDGRTVTLKLMSNTPMVEDTEYRVTVNTVADLAGNSVVPNSMVNFRSFVFSCGFVNFESYNGTAGPATAGQITGTAVSGLTGHASFPNSPSERFYLPAFDTRGAYPDDSHENFGGRVSGLFVPSVSGNYLFYLRSDDASELWFNAAGTDAAGATKITEEVGCCAAFEAHVSAPIPLVAGQRYFIMALYKEGGGGDYCQVAARREGDTSTLTPILSGNLGVYADAQGATLNLTQQPANQTFLIVPPTVDNPNPNAPTSITFTIGATASLPGVANQPIFYSWQRDGGSGFAPVTASGSNLTVFPTLADNGARYRAVLYIPGSVRTTDVATLTVAQPNTAPQFTCGPSQTVTQDAGAQVVTGWATDIKNNNIVRTPIQVSYDFSTVPTGVTMINRVLDVPSTASLIRDGLLKLTDAVNGSQGGFLTPALPAFIESFTVSFKARIGGGTCCGSALPDGSGVSRPADGMSVTIGEVEVPLSFPAAAEEGAAVGAGVVVAFDTWDNNGTDEAPALDVKAGGSVVAFQSLDGEREGGRPPAGPLVNDPATGQPLSYRTGTNFADVRVHLDSDGTLDVDFKNVRVIDNVQVGLGAFANGRVAFGARTGGANDNQWIDDLLIEAFPVDSSSAEAGQTVSFNVTTDHPEYFSLQPAVSSDGTLTYTPCPGMCGLARVTIVAQDNGGTAFGGRDSSAPCVIDINIVCRNDAPIALNWSADTVEDAAVNVPLLAFDTDGDALSYIIVSGPANGVLSGSGPVRTYTPNSSYTGPDSFSFRVNDGVVDSAVAVVSINVRQQGNNNQLPIAWITAEDLYDFRPNLTNMVVISNNGTNAMLSLDGSRSFDTDSDPLTHSWALDAAPAPFSTNVTATVTLGLGQHTFQLTVSDSKGAVGTDVLTVEVITLGEAITELMDKVNASNILLGQKRLFTARLKRAAFFVNQGQDADWRRHRKKSSCWRLQLGANFMWLFERNVWAGLRIRNPQLARELMGWADNIICAIDNGPCDDSTTSPRPAR